MPSCRTRRLAPVVFLAASVILSGCRRVDEIHSYIVPKELPPTDMASTAVPAGHPPLDAAAGRQTTALHFTAPDSWRQLPASGIRQAAFEITEGDARADVKVFDFANTAGPAIADPLANVNRWRAEVGLDPLAGDALSAAVEPLQIDGQQGTYVAVLPDAAGQEPSSPQRGTLAAMVARGDRVWFFKLTGDRGLVAAQQEAFRAFLESIRFVGHKGPDDGN